MDFYEVKHKCSCGRVLIIPIMPDMVAKAKAEYDMAEISAQRELSFVRGWLANASLFGLIKYWCKRG